MNEIWLFSGEGGRFASGVFSSLQSAVEWVQRNKLSGVLTKYPIDIGVYDWSIERKDFIPKKEHETSPQFIQRFTSACQEHYHFENGDSEELQEHEQ